MRASGGLVRPDETHPLTHEASVSPGQDVQEFMKATGFEAFGADHRGLDHPARDSPARVFADLEPVRLRGLALEGGAALLVLVVCDLEFHQVTAAAFCPSIARLKSARSRWFSAISRRTRMAQRCFGIS